jgi:hypothetical protein
MNLFCESTLNDEFREAVLNISLVVAEITGVFAVNFAAVLFAKASPQQNILIKMIRYCTGDTHFHNDNFFVINDLIVSIIIMLYTAFRGRNGLLDNDIRPGDLACPRCT